MFETHKLNDKGFEEVKKFKTTIAMAANEAMNNLPEGRDKAIFKTKLEEAMFFGTRAIASTPGNYNEVVSYPESAGTVFNTSNQTQ